jgi:hypothetical protein
MAGEKVEMEGDKSMDHKLRALSDLSGKLNAQVFKWNLVNKTTANPITAQLSRLISVSKLTHNPNQDTRNLSPVSSLTNLN